MGVLAATLTRADGRPRIVMNLLIGVIGALAGGRLLGPLIGGSTSDQVDFSGVALLASLAGATLLLTISNIVHRETSR
jgi:uncharacterized membrane protein YeaQ/YmgE (transglycosylase-associated protein family)